MSSNQNIALVASAITDPSRAGILTALLDGRFHTASELSSMIGVTPQTCSYHLHKLLESDLIQVESQGRHRYFAIQNVDIATILESLLTITPPVKVKSLKQSREDIAIRHARTCYNHIAGSLGVQIADALLERGFLFYEEEDFILTETGEKFFEDFQVNLKELRKKRRSFCHKCLDWSERRHHLAGALGTALLERCIELGWILRLPKTRAISITTKGKKGFNDVFSIQI